MMLSHVLFAVGIYVKSMAIHAFFVGKFSVLKIQANAIYVEKYIALTILKNVQRVSIPTVHLILGDVPVAVRSIVPNAYLTIYVLLAKA